MWTKRTHRIAPGETLTGIAMQHGFGENWRPIWNLNTKVHRDLTTSDPNMVPVGATLRIPRTPEEYTKVLQSLDELDRDSRANMREVRSELQSAKTTVDRQAAAVDLAADVLLAGKGAVKAATKLGTRYGTYMVRKKGLEVLNKFASTAVATLEPHAGTVFQNLGDGALSQVIHLQAGHRASGATMATKAGTGFLKDAGKQSAVYLTKMALPAETAFGFAELVGIACDLVLKGLEAVSPSSIAKAVVWAIDEHPDDTYKKATDMIDAAEKKALERVRQAKERVLQEKSVVYGP